MSNGRENEIVRQARETLSKFPRSISLLTWAYNEEENIAGFLERMTRLMESLTDDYEILLVEDNCTDRTYEIAREFQLSNPFLRIIRNYENLDCGINCRIAIRNASKEFLFWQTVDESYDISNIRDYLQYLHEFTVVQGVRCRPQNAFNWKTALIGRSDNLRKGLISLVNYWFIRILFRVNLSDFQNVTIYPSRFIQGIQLEGRSSFVNPECLLKSYWKGARIKEVPIDFIPRKKGKPKGTRPLALLAAVKDILFFWFKWIVLRGEHRKNKGTVEVYSTSRHQDSTPISHLSGVVVR